MKLLMQFLAVAAVVFVADFIWLGFVMQGYYQRELQSLLRQGSHGFSPRIVPALLVYILIPLGVVLFVAPRIATSGSLVTAAVWGGIFGLVVYGVYDLTNLSILERWPLTITIADIVWGCFLCATSAVCMTLVGRSFV